MLNIFKRGRIFWARGSVHGKAIYVSLDTQFKEVAWQRAIDLELRGGRKDVKWEEFRKDFLRWKQPHAAESTRRRYEFVLSRFGAFLKKRGIDLVHHITPEVIARYCEDRQLDEHPHSGRKLGPEGLKCDLRLLHGAFAYALDCGRLDANPVISPGLNTAGGETLPFTQKEIETMLGAPYVRGSAARRALLLIFLYTGLRISDVAAMPRKAVNFEAGNIVLRTKKRGKVVSLALHPDLREALKQHTKNLNDAQRFSAFLFPTLTGRQFWSQSLDAYLRRIFDHCGIEKGHAHRFRDTFAVRLLEHGASLYDVSKLLGITMRVAERHYSPYVFELQERGRRLVEKLDFDTSSVQLERNASGSS